MILRVLAVRAVSLIVVSSAYAANDLASKHHSHILNRHLLRLENRRCEV